MVVGALAIPPAIIPATSAGGLIVDLFERDLADVSDHERAGAAVSGTVKTPSPGIAKAEAPDFSKNAGLASERVAGRDVVALGIAVGHRHVESQHLAEQRCWILRVVEWVVRGATVAHSDIQEAVRAEHQIAAVVVGERLRDESLAAGPEQVESARRIRTQWIRG